MKAPQAPSGMRRLRWDVSEATDPSRSEGASGAAGLAEKLAGVDPEMVEDAATSTREAPIVLNENPKVGGSG